MKDEKKGLTRRDLIRGAAGVTLAGALSTWGMGGIGKAAAAESQSRVILVRDLNAIDSGGEPNSAVLAEMLDSAVTALFETDDPKAAWRKAIRPSDTVGIKSNVWSYLRTPYALEETIESRVMECGVPPERVSVDDRGVRRNRVFKEATALINVRPLRTHYWSGVGGLLKNYIMFSQSPSGWHADSCADLGGVWELPEVKGKTRLNVLVLLTPLFHGKGPHHFMKKYTWFYGGLLVGTDPVAVDATGLRILEAKRRDYFRKERVPEIPAQHIRVAQDKYGLGIADPDRILIERIGNMEGVLI